MSLAGCGIGMEPLMPTPILYTDTGLEPLDHIPDAERWVPRRVYYATTRQRGKNEQEISYGNDPSDQISVGLTLIGFGGHDMTWSDLNRVSKQAARKDIVTLSIAGVVEVARFPFDATPTEAARPDRAGWLLEDLNDSIEDARDKDLLIYVHGAKVNFYNACAFAAQLDHFMGRDMTSIAFSWPTRQNIFAYVRGADVTRAPVLVQPPVGKFGRAAGDPDRSHPDRARPRAGGVPGSLDHALGLSATTGGVAAQRRTQEVVGVRGGCPIVPERVEVVRCTARGRASLQRTANGAL